MATERMKLFPRILKFWALHLALAVAGALALSLGGVVQSVISAEAAAPVTTATGVLVTLLYIFLMARASRRVLRSRREGVLFGLAGALPLLLIVLGAVLYLRAVPYNTIGYGYILLPVMLPFMGWIEQVFPLLPYHILSLAVPAAFAGAVITGAAGKGGAGGR